MLNLSYGTDGVQDYRLDPLTHAVENAWRAGIVVVVAGGNSGTASPKLNNPAYDPYVLAVGAADTNADRRRLRRPRARVQQPGRRQPPGRPGRPRPLDQVAARPGLLPRRGAPGRARRQPVLQGQRLVAGRGCRLGCRRAAAAEPARPAAGPGQGAAAQLGRADAGRRRRRSRRRRARRLPRLPRRDPCHDPELADLHRARLARAGPRHPARGRRRPGADRRAAPAGRVRRPHLGTGQRRVQGAGPAAPGPAGHGPATAGASRPGPGKSWSGKSWSGKSWSGDAWSGKSWSGKSWSSGAWTGKSWSSTGWTGSSWVGKSWSGEVWAAADWGDP